MELKIEVVLPEKERGKEELSVSASGKGSPRAYQGNGTARHFHAEECLPAPHPYAGTQDCVEAAVCHVKDLENGQWVLGWVGCESTSGGEPGRDGPREKLRRLRCMFQVKFQVPSLASRLHQK